eukprot:XP_001710227.1 Hypothetical protein GL50803_32236 [Giardia lamblia ATCC 50803]
MITPALRSRSSRQTLERTRWALSSSSSRSTRRGSSQASRSGRTAGWFAPMGTRSSE